ncbi:MAG TPA: hypothetical protein EYG70_00950 [Sulfurimonas sp.]|nr:hypothetical protein [Sulfurimonas sp.]
MSEERKDAMSKVTRLIDDEIKKIYDDERYRHPIANLRTDKQLQLIRIGLSGKIKLLYNLRREVGKIKISYSLRYELEKIEKDGL